MDAPRIQYAKSEDGFDIAYWTFGRGCGHGHANFRHIQKEWEWRSWDAYTQLQHSLIRVL